MAGCKCGRVTATSASTSTHTSSSVTSSKSVAPELDRGKWGSWWRRIAPLASDASARFALVEREGRYLFHDLVLLLMEQFLLLGYGLDVMVHSLGRVGGRRCHELALICQGRHLGRDGFGQVIVRVFVRESTERILLEWKGWGISLMPCGGGCCVEAILEGILDHPAKFDLCLCCVRKLVPIFKRTGVQSCGE
jgi:hypothetical protein